MNELTARDALFAEAFKELDALLFRVEKLPQLIIDAQNGLAKTTEILDVSAARFRAEMNVVGTHAKKDIIEGLVQMQEKLVVKTTDEQVRLMHEAARAAFNSEAFNKVESLTRELTKAMEYANNSVRNTIILQVSISILGAIITSVILHIILKTQ